MEKYSLIIIGAGITGLSAGLAWAKHNDTSKKPVLILEKQPIPGGFVTSFARKGFVFDTVQLIPDISDELEYLDINIPMKKFGGYFARLFLINPDSNLVKIINIPSGLDKFEKMLNKRFPSDKAKINRFLKYSLAMYDELHHLKVEPGTIDLAKIILKCSKIIKNSDKTFSEYVKSFSIENKDFLELCNFFAAFSSLPADRAAALIVVGAMLSTLKGTYRPEKGFIDFPARMSKKYREMGGEIRFGAEAERIISDEGIVKGVLLKDGTFLEAENVISTIDTKHALKKLVGFDTLRELSSSYTKKAEDVLMSPSSMTIFLGLDGELPLERLGFDCGYNVLTTGGDTFSKLFDNFDNGIFKTDDRCFHTAVICPSLITGGRQNISIRVYPMAMGDWKKLREENYHEYVKKKEEIAEFYIDKVEKYMIPGLHKHIVIKDISSPATYSRYSGSPTGSIYDMSPYPSNFGRKRLKMRTPLQGFYISQFAHGIFPAFQQALQAVDMIMEGKVMGGYSRFRKLKD